MSNLSPQVEVAGPISPPLIKADQNITTAAKGGGLVFIGSIFQNGTRFLIGVLLARLLGANQLGLCNLTLTAAEFATGLAVLGLDVATVRYVALYAGRRDEKGIWGVIQVALGGATILSLVAGIGLYLLADPIATQLFNEPRLEPLLYFAAILIPLLGLNDILAAALQGFKKMQYMVIAQNVVQPLVRLALIIFIAILIGLTAKRAIIVYILANTASSILFLYFLHRHFSLKRPIRTARRNPREMLNFSLPVYLSNLIGAFGSNIQTVLLGTMSTIANVGIFAVATQVNLVGKLFHTAVVTSSMPIISELYDLGDRERLGRFYQTVTKWTLTVNLPLFLVVIIYPMPILSIFGESFVGGTTALVLLAWANLINVATGICGAMLDMTGNTKLKLFNSVVAVSLTLTLNIILIPHWGLVGAAVAALVAAAVVNFLRLTEVFILFKLLPYNLSFAKPIFAGVVALWVSGGLRSLQASEMNIVFIFVDILIILAVYGGMILLLGLSPEDRLVLNGIGRRLKVMRLKHEV